MSVSDWSRGGAGTSSLALRPIAPLDAYLASSSWIDHDHPEVRALAETLAAAASSRRDLVRRSFEWVRDEVRHSLDHRMNPVTCRASDVLRHRTGYCYAKAHLLAALLRANGVPTGLCYQRLSLEGGGAPFCLHGLNAVWLEELGWYRLDARGNRADIDARFDPPRERLAFPLRDEGEVDLPEIQVEPLPVVVEALTRFDDWEAVLANLPDLG